MKQQETSDRRTKRREEIQNDARKGTRKAADSQSGGQAKCGSNKPSGRPFKTGPINSSTPCASLISKAYSAGHWSALRPTLNYFHRSTSSLSDVTKQASSLGKTVLILILFADR
ncbi:unnamed protein product [Caenorhabditis auriculariae]|uniref:Uncharacterized protein n=1 Tax=Caenorhabditis auriculariae TaxID=2777116 RepID=A0A8S1HH93_9PELO|nr:unnamed protein product [Caenorhabditis auriculariae]